VISALAPCSTWACCLMMGAQHEELRRSSSQLSPRYPIVDVCVCVDVCGCDVLQCVAVCCSMLQCLAVCCSACVCGCVWMRELPYNATHCNTLQHTATHCDTLQYTTTHCNTQQHTAIHCNTLQHTASHCCPMMGAQHKTSRRSSLQTFKEVTCC